MGRQAETPTVLLGEEGRAAAPTQEEAPVQGKEAEEERCAEESGIVRRLIRSILQFMRASRPERGP